MDLIVNPIQVPVEEVLWIADDDQADVAFLRLGQHIRGHPPPLAVLIHDDRIQVGNNIVAIGFPAEDDNVEEGLLRQVFGTQFRVKRIAPGKVTLGPKKIKKKTILHHDSSTLGGSSGSAIMDLRSGLVLGLHYGGLVEPRCNLAVCGSLLVELLKQHVPTVEAVTPDLNPQKGEEEEEEEATIERPSANSYRNRKGYNPKFLESAEIPLPEISQDQMKTLVRLTNAGNNNNNNNASYEIKYTHFSVVMNVTRQQVNEWSIFKYPCVLLISFFCLCL